MSYYNINKCSSNYNILKISDREIRTTNINIFAAKRCRVRFANNLKFYIKVMLCDKNINVNI